jgi:glutamate formiminotransferase
VAFDAVCREAAALGVTVRQSELVGLLPRAALEGTTPAALRLSGFREDQILEERLARTLPNP